MTLLELAAEPMEAFRARATPLSGVEPLRALGVDIDGLAKLGDTCVFEAPVFIRAFLAGRVEIGAFTYTAAGLISEAVIGRYCPLAAGVNIGPAEHPTDWFSVHPFQYGGTGLFRGPDYDALVGAGEFSPYAAALTRIGHDCWLGYNAVVRTGRRIGNGSVVGAGAVVTTDIAEYTVAAGAPARYLRKRFEAPLARKLEKLQWWDWDLAPIKDRLDFSRPDECCKRIKTAIRNGSIAPAQFARIVTRRDKDRGVWMWADSAARH